MEEREIDIREILINWLAGLPLMIALFLLGGVLFGAVGFIKDSKFEAKMIIMGAVLFVFIYMAITGISYVFGHAVKFCDDLKSIYGVEVLGKTALPYKKKDGKTKKKILSLKDKKMSRLEKAELIKLAGISVKKCAINADANKIKLIGNELDKNAELLRDVINIELKTVNILVEMIDGVLYKSDSLDKLDKDDTAVILVKIGTTTYEEIHSELEICKRQGVKVLGVLEYN